MHWVQCERCGHTWQSRARIPQCSKCKSTHVKVLTLNEPADRPPAIVFDKLNEASMSVNENLNEADKLIEVPPSNGFDKVNEGSMSINDNLNELLIDEARHSGSDGSMRKSAPEHAQPLSVDSSMRANEMSAVSGMLMVLGVLLLVAAAGWWLMTRRGHSSPLTRGQLAPWE